MTTVSILNVVSLNIESMNILYILSITVIEYLPVLKYYFDIESFNDYNSRILIYTLNILTRVGTCQLKFYRILCDSYKCIKPH